jgi:hypothetical protein
LGLGCGFGMERRGGRWGLGRKMFLGSWETVEGVRGERWGIEEMAGWVWEDVKAGMGDAKRRVRSFKDGVDAKAQEEKKEGRRSGSFDLCA